MKILILIFILVGCSDTNNLDTYKKNGWVPETCNCKAIDIENHITTDSCITFSNIYKCNVSWYSVGKRSMDREREENKKLLEQRIENLYH